MNSGNHISDDLETELAELRQRVADLEASQENWKRTAEALRASDTRFRDLFQHSRDAIYFTRRDGGLIEANPALLFLFGYTREELMTRGVQVLYVNSGDRSRFQQQIEQNGSVKDFSVPFRCKDGKIIECMLTSSVWRDDAGRVAGYQGIIRDVTEEKQTERALLRSNETFQALLNAISDSAFLLDREGYFLAANESTALAVGRRPHDLIGESVFGSLPLSLATNCRERFDELLQTGQGMRFEDEYDGRRFEVSLLPVVDHHGSVTRVAGFSREVTEEWLAEERLQQAFDELEGLVADRTAELVSANESLRLEIAERRQAERTVAAELRKFRALYDLATALTADHTLDENLALVVEESRELLGSDTAYIALRDEATGDVSMRTLSGVRTRAFKELVIPSGSGLGGKVAKTGKGYIVRDYYQEIEPLLHETMKGEGLISGIAAPIQIGSNNLGVLYAFNRTVTEFTSSDLDTLSLLGNLAAVEITHKRAQRKLEESQQALEGQVSRRTAELTATNEKLRQEIRDRHKAEQALVESERMLANILAASPLAIAFVEYRKLKWANVAMTKMFGYGEDTEFLGKHPREFYVSEDEYRRVRRAFLDSLCTGRPAEIEASFKRKDGSVFYGLINMSAMDPSVATKGTISTIADISDRKKAEDALKASEEKHRTIVENIDAVYYEVDLHGNWVFLNEAVSKVFGLEREALVGRNYRDFTTVENAEALLQVFHEVFRTGKPLKSYYWKLQTGAMEKHIELSVALARDNDGTPVGFRGIARDVTEQKRAEQELIKLEKLESIGVLAGGIAHDFNNILTAMQGNISMARLLASPENKLHERLEEAEKACCRARDLTRQLLTFAKGGAPIKKVASVRTILEDAGAYALWGSNVLLEFFIAPDLWNVEVDEVQIGQVMANLLINADQAMPKGGVINITANNVVIGPDEGLPVREGPYVDITVSDGGTGIPAELLVKIFDPYFTTKPHGSGLGLATAYSIIKNHGGFIKVNSEMGKGTVFRILLPAEIHRSDRALEVDETPVRGGGRILLMDDEEPIRVLATELLEMLGYEVETASDGARAIAMWESAFQSGAPFDVLILDLTIPAGMGGEEVLRTLQNSGKTVKAIVSSGYSNDPIMADYASYGFCGVLPKPYNARQLSEAVHRAISPGPAAETH